MLLVVRRYRRVTYDDMIIRSIDLHFSQFLETLLQTLPASRIPYIIIVINLLHRKVGNCWSTISDLLSQMLDLDSSSYLVYLVPTTHCIFINNKRNFCAYNAKEIERRTYYTYILAQINQCIYSIWWLP